MNDRFQYLSVKYIDGNISSLESDELVALVKGNKAYQKELAEMLVQDAAIQNVLGAQSQMENEIKASGTLGPISAIPKHNSRRFQATKKQSPWPMLAIAALVFFGILIPGFLYKKSLDEANSKKAIGSNNIDSIQSQSLAQVTTVYGQVYKVLNGSREKIVKGANIKIDDIIESDSNSYVKMETNKKSLIFLNQESKLKWNEKSIDLEKGGVYAEINKKDLASVYRFNSGGNCRIAITGTAFEWIYQNNNAELKVKEGKVEFYKGKEKKIVTKNQMISENDFEKGLKTIKPDIIASWLDIFQGGFIYFDEFNDDNYNRFWTLKTSQDSFQRAPKGGLFCAGKGQRTELVSKDIVLDGVKPVSIIFKSKNIKASNNFQYGYEIWNDNKILIRQGYAVEQINLDSYHIKETRNFGESKDIIDQVKTKDGPLPDISFGLKLDPTKVSVPEKIEYKKGNTMSDLTVSVKLNVFKVVFYVETVNESSQVEWLLRGFAFGYGDTVVDNIYSEKLLKWNAK